jgi:hypothetical protein
MRRGGQHVMRNAMVSDARARLHQWTVLRFFRGTCFVSGLLALPLCGAAVTFFAAAKKVTKESSFFSQRCKDVATVALLSGPAPKCRPQKTEGLGARHALCHRAVNELAQQSFIRFRFAGREVHRRAVEVRGRGGSPLVFGCAPRPSEARRDRNAVHTTLLECEGCQCVRAPSRADD